MRQTKFSALDKYYKMKILPCQAPLDGVVVSYLNRAIPLLRKGGRLKHFVMHSFNNHVKVLDNVTPIDFDVRTVFNERNI